jgi:hypothetical protein
MPIDADQRDATADTAVQDLLAGSQAHRGGGSTAGSESTASSQSQIGEPETPPGQGTKLPGFVTATREDDLSCSLDRYKSALENAGSRRGIANVLVNVKNLTKTKLFHRLKHYKMAVSEGMKKRNATTEKFVKDYITREIPDLNATEEDWKFIQVEVTRTLRQKRCTAGQATAKIFHGKIPCNKKELINCFQYLQVYQLLVNFNLTLNCSCLQPQKRNVDN